jgi:hypothetical protein
VHPLVHGGLLFPSPSAIPEPASCDDDRRSMMP